jgi:hypothetical protein
VSGILALLLERNPKLTPADIRRILTASARRLGTGERDDNFGAGLIDPLKALQLADPRIVTTTPPAGPIGSGSRFGIKRSIIAERARRPGAMLRTTTRRRWCLAMHFAVHADRDAVL